MSSCIVTCEMTTNQLKRVVDDFLEAIEYETKTGFPTRVYLTGFGKGDKPIYETEEERRRRKKESELLAAKGAGKRWQPGALF